MNRAEAAEKEWIDRDAAERAQTEAWERQRDALRATQQRSEHVEAAPLRGCPQCATALEIRTFHGVQVHRCASCRGVWLEDGQLESLTSSEPGLWQRMRRALSG